MFQAGGCCCCCCCCCRRRQLCQSLLFLTYSSLIKPSHRFLGWTYGYPTKVPPLVHRRYHKGCTYGKCHPGWWEHYPPWNFRMIRNQNCSFSQLGWGSEVCPDFFWGNIWDQWLVTDANGSNPGAPLSQLVWSGMVSDAMYTTEGRHPTGTHAFYGAS